VKIKAGLPARPVFWLLPVFALVKQTTVVFYQKYRF